MAEAEATKQTFFDEMAISLTRATPRASGDCRRTRENRDPGRRFDRREWRRVSHGRKRPPRAARAAMIDMIGSRTTRGVQRAQSSPGGCLSTHRQPGPATRRACASQKPQSSLLQASKIVWARSRVFGTAPVFASSTFGLRISQAAGVKWSNSGTSTGITANAASACFDKTFGTPNSLLQLSALNSLPPLRS